MALIARTALLGLALTMTIAPRLLADEGMWVFNNLPLEAAQGEVRLRAVAGVGRAPPVVGGPVQQRRLGLVRLGRRPGDDQPPRRGRHAPEDQHGGEGLLLDRLPRRRPGPRRSRPPDLELNVPGRHRGRDRPGQRRRRAGDMNDADGRHRPPRGDGEDRAGGDREERPAERRGHALPGRAVSPLHLQEVHRRPARLRPRVRHRLLRRRRGQLRVPPLLPRRRLLPRLRGRRAGEGRAPPEVERGRARRPATSSSSPATRVGPVG